MKYAILKAEGVCVWGGGGLIDSRKQVVGGIELVKKWKIAASLSFLWNVTYWTSTHNMLSI